MHKKAKLDAIFSRHGLRPEPIISVSLGHLSEPVIAIRQASAAAPSYFTVDGANRLALDLILASHGAVASPIQTEIEKARAARNAAATSGSQTQL
jgi:hypothetical protein